MDSIPSFLLINTLYYPNRIFVRTFWFRRTKSSNCLEPTIRSAFILHWAVFIIYTKKTRVAIVQNVGYPNLSYHIFVRRISGCPAQITMKSWIPAGRGYLASEFPNYLRDFRTWVFRIRWPSGLAEPSPWDCRIGAYPWAYHQQCQRPLNLSGNLFTDPPTPGCLGRELSYAREVCGRRTNSVMRCRLPGIRAKSVIALPGSQHAGAVLGSQLALVAKLIDGGCKTKFTLAEYRWVWYPFISGRVRRSHGWCSFRIIEGCVRCDCRFYGWPDIAGTSRSGDGHDFSEFGRRIISKCFRRNRSWSSTTHLIFGSHVIPAYTGIIGHWPTVECELLTFQWSLIFVLYFVHYNFGGLVCVGSADRDNILLKKVSEYHFWIPTTAWWLESNQTSDMPVRSSSGVSQSMCRSGTDCIPNQKGAWWSLNCSIGKAAWFRLF